MGELLSFYFRGTNVKLIKEKNLLHIAVRSLELQFVKPKKWIQLLP